MRIEFIDLDDAPTREAAEDLAPWACEIIEVDGGWTAFEAAADADIFASQS